MAECNTCGGYLSIEDKIRLSMKCDANGNVVWQGALLNQIPTDEEIMTLLGDRIALWTKPDEGTETYFTNKIGVQDRQAIGGIIHPGRAIQYDGSKSQYSSTNGNMPANFRLANNSITVFCRVKMAAAPAGNSLLFGYAGGNNGMYWAAIANDGKLSLVVRHSVTITIKSLASICDGGWHDVFALIDKSGNAALYIDNVLQGSPVNISEITFSDSARTFLIGGQPSYYSGIKQVRDVRLFSSAITAEADRDAIHRGDYVAGATSWWFCEGGKESAVYNMKDVVGVNHLVNSGFDATSLVSGAWKSLLNKFGYSSVNYESADLITGDGIFDNAAEWTFTATKFEVAAGVAHFKAVDDSARSCRNKRVLSVPTGTVLKCTFDIIEGPATFVFCNEGQASVSSEGTYAVGTHTVIFKTLAAIVNIGILATLAGGAFKIDNWVATIYEAAIIEPKMDAAIPITDVWSRALVFADQAKYNLLKIDADTVQMPDYVGELFDAAEPITINDWYNAGGEGNEIDLSAIEPYQTKRQYYNAGELIIIKSDAVLTDEEDTLLKKKLMLVSESYTPLTLMNVAKGDLTGANADIYKAKNLLTGDAYFDITLTEQVTPSTDPAGKYIAIGWADFFTPEDPQIMLALCAKYGMTHTFYRQIKPLSNDPRNTGGNYSRNELKMIEAQGSQDGNHSFLHISSLYNCPLYDGRNTPSNNDMRVARADDTNEFGYAITATVDDSIGSSLRESWLKLSATIGGKQWQNLSDAECAAIRQSVSAFMMPLDGQNSLQVLQSLDYLSNRYCGTTGLSVKDNYITRTPNTADGLEPSTSNRILGGIFQGAASTQNQEIWERILLIEEAYKKEFEGKINNHKFWASAGGHSRQLTYRPVNAESEFGNYIDKAYTMLLTGVAKVPSSITGLTRSWIDCLRSSGYKATMASSGHGYATFASDTLTRLECQSIYQRNLSFKKPDNLGDGFSNAIRQWLSTLTETDIDNALASADVEKYLYDLCATDERFTSITAYTPGNFNAYLNEALKYIAWGKIPDSVDDSGAAGSLEKRASMAFAHEALMRFCVRAGIKLISHDEAINIALTNYSPSNYFPNYQLDTTAKTILDSVNAPVYPDGWNGGEVLSEDTGSGAVNVLHIDTAGTFFTRQYAIKPGSFTLALRAKGIATIKVRKIKNNDAYNRTDGSAFTEIASISVNAENYTAYSTSVVIENAAMETYAPPTTPEESAYQNYMRGFGNKICAIQIEVVITGENYLKAGNFALTV